MFGDIGQGAIILILGLYLNNKFKKGMPKRIGALFIPMGVVAIIFGVFYGSIFLIEVSHPPAWLPSIHSTEAVPFSSISLQPAIALSELKTPLVSNTPVEGSMVLIQPFYTAILPNPASKEGTIPFMEIIVKLAIVEIFFGLFLNAINQIKKKNYIGILGEKGVGMAFYVYAIFAAIGPGFTPNIGATTMNFMMLGLSFSFIEPIIHSLLGGHFKPMQAISEGIGGLLMTFVEGLGNMFSFLRIAAFALAHASLAVAAIALGNTVGIIPGLIVMNVIAMTFELISSMVQSMRLLYYEFMGKFYVGQGTPYIPFKYEDADYKEI
jgi:V/A-type H+-transporting ATPase subunit I